MPHFIIIITLFITANRVHGRLTLHTSDTGIFTMASWTEVICPNSLTGKPWTVNKSCLSPSTQQVIQKDGASTTAEVSIAEYYGT